MGSEPGGRVTSAGPDRAPAGDESLTETGGVEPAAGRRRESRFPGPPPPEDFFWVSRTVQAVYWVLGVVDGLIITRVLLKALAANPDSALTQLIYAITDPLVFPFMGMFVEAKIQGAVFELSSVVALVFYVFFAWAVSRLIWLIHPGKRY